ncbi:MAG: hypothetical protein QG670_2663 [Thermoproteota archaeon]|nr:hypothetical protein [Thermoproteota archaeon]
MRFEMDKDLEDIKKLLEAHPDYRIVDVSDVLQDIERIIEANDPEERMRRYWNLREKIVNGTQGKR